ncbi:MAG: suppressor of fused domain protein [Pyrinomonadaceae bacterium]|nr:suppressor of fused domain protein [Pyrinomonadaceae bacterium]
MSSWIEEYLKRTDEIANGEPSFHRVSEKTNGDPITVITYPPSSNSGLQISLTAGLSSYEHEAWQLGKPELSIAIDSTDMRWGFAIGEIADRLKGDCPFCYCDVINFGTPISEESDMSAFIVFAPSFGPKDFFTLDLGNRKINIAQMYPIYSSEIEVFDALGPEAFFAKSAEFFQDPLRPAMTI